MTIPRRLLRILTLSLLFLPAAARADQMPLWQVAVNAPTSSAREVNGEPVTIAMTAGAVATLAGAPDEKVSPEAAITVDGPVVVGSSSLARIYARLGIGAQPDQTVELARADTFRAAKVDLGLGRVVGRRRSGGQDITTSVVAEWGFASRIPGDTTPRKRLVRHYGGGLRLAERKSGAHLQVLYGRDEAAGARGYGQWMVSGAVPVAGTSGILLITGQATLSAGPERARAPQRDILQIGVSVNVGQALSKIGGR